MLTYLGQPFKDDFRFLLELDEFPEFAYSFGSQQNPPDFNNPSRRRASTAPFDYYGRKVSSDGGKTSQSGWEPPETFPPTDMPEISSPADLRRLIRPQSVHVMTHPKNGLTRIGFDFACRWDDEHGLGVSTHAATVTGVGGPEEACAEYYA